VGRREHDRQGPPVAYKTWEESKIYILKPLEKRGEMDQGIALLAYYSLMRVARGFLLALPWRRRSDLFSACRER